MKTTGKRYHILVVDDEPSVCQAIKMLLEYDGHEARTVESGEAALAQLEQNTFNLIMMDYYMAGMKGNQLAAIIKQDRPDQPIIMATAFAADFRPSGRLTGNVDHVLSKPFSLTELREAIALVMSLKAVTPAIPAASDFPAVPPEVPPSQPGESGSGRTQV